jgi:TPR repeat protein
VLATIAIAWPTFAQKWGNETAVPSELQAALAKADAGDPHELTKLADSGRADAQYYAGVMYLFGRGSIARDTKRGCAYEEKASASRADAMHLVGLCYQHGLTGAADREKAKAAFSRADQMGFPKSRCALGQLLMTEPGEGPRGLELCQVSAEAGDVSAQLTVANAYFSGGPVKADHAAAAKWYGMAAAQKSPEAARRLGQMYANADGVKRDKKKAMELWKTAEQAGDPMVAILVADELFSDLTGGKTPEYGQYKFKGGVPVGDVEVIEDWYKLARDRDPRPEVKQRAVRALNILAGFKKAASTVSVQKTK